MQKSRLIALLLFASLVAGARVFGQQSASQPATGDSLRLSGTQIDSGAFNYFVRRQDFLHSLLSQFDSVGQRLHFRTRSRVPALVLPDSFLTHGAARNLDLIGERLQREQTTEGPVLDFGTMARSLNELARQQKKPRRPDIRELPLPSPLEIDVLSLLWTHGPSTGTELFLQLDSAALAALTAEQFWNVLHRMAERGFVSERIISPQLIMTFAIGPFAVPVEMSPKNLKNREYLYKPLVDQKEMLSYLLAQNYLARRSGDPGVNGAANRVSELLYRLFLNQQRFETND